jgi:hypothetical protein
MEIGFIHFTGTKLDNVSEILKRFHNENTNILRRAFPKGFEKELSSVNIAGWGSQD